MTTGFEQDGLPHLHERLHQRVDSLLQEGLSTGYLDQRALVALDLTQDVLEAALATLVKRVRRIAPRAAQVAGREAHEDARPASIRGLALDGMEDFVNRQHPESIPNSQNPNSQR